MEVVKNLVCVLNRDEDFFLCFWKVNLSCLFIFTFVERRGGRVVGCGGREIGFKFFWGI